MFIIINMFIISLPTNIIFKLILYFLNEIIWWMIGYQLLNVKKLGKNIEIMRNIFFENYLYDISDKIGKYWENYFKEIIGGLVYDCLKLSEDLDKNKITFDELVSTLKKDSKELIDYWKKSENYKDYVDDIKYKLNNKLVEEIEKQKYISKYDK